MHSGGALVSSAPTELTLHQPSKRCTNQANVAGDVLAGGALVSSAPTKQELHQPSYTAPTEQYRYTSCYVGALETSAPPDISSEFCAICGRSSPAEASVNSVKSVGEPLFAWLVQGENIVRYCTENAAIETKSVKTSPERAKLFNICKLETQDNSLY